MDDASSPWQFTLLLQDPNARWVLLAVTLVSISAALVGTFAYLRKRAMIGDAISHAILPGICLSFLLTSSKHPLVLLIGAVVSGGFAALAIDYLAEKTRLKADTLLALVLSVMYGFGVLLLTFIQQSGNATQSGLDKFLFGSAAALTGVDVRTFGIFAGLLAVVTIALFKAFRLTVFDAAYGQTRGIAVKRFQILMTLFTVIAVALGIQAVGIVLTAALIVAPPAAARYWTHRLAVMLPLAVLIAVISATTGTALSFSYEKTPTGPLIVLVLSALTLLSIIFGQKRGLLPAWLRTQRAKRLSHHPN